jgi:hypothetical protein
MKRLLVALVSFGMILSSCKKEQMEVTYSQVDLSELSSSVAQSLDENYPDAEAVSALKVSNSEVDYLVLLNTNEEVAISAAGEVMDPSAAHRGGRGPRGPRGGHGPGHGGGHHGIPPGVIPADSLPLVVKNYIALNYPSDTILGGRMDSTCANGLVLGVLVGKQGVKPTKLVFDANGAYLYSATRVAYINTPVAVRDSIASAYVGYNVRRMAVQQTLANASNRYEVFVNLQRVRKAVTISDAGIVICTK